MLGTRQLGVGALTWMWEMQGEVGTQRDILAGAGCPPSTSPGGATSPQHGQAHRMGPQRWQLLKFTFCVSLLNPLFLRVDQLHLTGMALHLKLLQPPLSHGTTFLLGQGYSICLEAPAAAAHQDSWPGSGPSEPHASPASLLTPLHSDWWVLDEPALPLASPVQLWHLSLPQQWCRSVLMALSGYHVP